MTTKRTAFCPKCHKPAYTVEQDGENVKISQSNNTFITMKITSKVNFNINCPSGHKNKITLDKDNKIVVGEAIVDSKAIAPNDSN